FHLGVERFVLPARPQEEVAPLLGRPLERRPEQVLDPLPSCRVHEGLALASSRSSQAFATVQSRLAVARDVCRLTATSSIVSPPNTRSSTTCACLGSRAASRFRRSSRISI